MEMSSLAVFWEVEHTDGTILREAAGDHYTDIKRSKFREFRFVYEGKTIFATWPPPGASGHNFVYRRRTAMAASDISSVVLVAGWVPMGPAYAVYPASGMYRVSEEGFVSGEPELFPAVPMPGEAFFDSIN